MPGPVSDSYDPEFGTGANADDVCKAVTFCRNIISIAIKDDTLQNIVDLVHMEGRDLTPLRAVCLTVREWRIVRFALNRALESF